MDIPEASLVHSVKQQERTSFSKVEFKQVLTRFHGIGRDCDTLNEEDYGNVEFYGLDEQFARRVAGKHNKNVLFVLFGDLGSGKSMALLSLALGCSRWLSALLGGKPSDYFTFGNIAVIDPETLQSKLENLKKYNIYLLDDFGTAFDARNFMSKDNKSLSHILQTCRTSNNIILVSAPHGAMLDVNIHRLAMWYAEVAESRHDEGISFIKVLKTVQMFREGKIRRIYQTKKNVSAVRYYVSMPPKALRHKYDKVREDNAKILAQKRAIEEAEKAAKAERGEGKSGARKKFTDEEFISQMDVYVQEKTPTTMLSLSETLGVTATTLRDYLKKCGFVIERVPKSKNYVIVKN